MSIDTEPPRVGAALQALRSSRGLSLDAASPLAQHLSQFINQSTRTSLTAARATASGEVLYRMVVPAKVAAQVGKGLVRPMAPKAMTGGAYSALVNTTSGKIVGHAVYVPVPPLGPSPPAVRSSPWPLRSCSWPSRSG